MYFVIFNLKYAIKYVKPVADLGEGSGSLPLIKQGAVATSKAYGSGRLLIDRLSPRLHQYQTISHTPYSILRLSLDADAFDP